MLENVFQTLSRTEKRSNYYSKHKTWRKIRQFLILLVQTEEEGERIQVSNGGGGGGGWGWRRWKEENKRKKNGRNGRAKNGEETDDLNEYDITQTEPVLVEQICRSELWYQHDKQN